MFEKVFRTAWNAIKGFVLFWKDFLVGDSPELAFGVIIILGFDYLLHNSDIADVISIILLVLLLMIITVWRKVRHHS